MTFKCETTIYYSMNCFFAHNNQQKETVIHIFSPNMREQNIILDFLPISKVFQIHKVLKSS